MISCYLLILKPKTVFPALNALNRAPMTYHRFESDISPAVEVDDTPYAGGPDRLYGTERKENGHEPIKQLQYTKAYWDTRRCVLHMSSLL